MKVICAFSSNSRELYMADIYRALTLPNGHILHFRYKKEYIDNNLLLKNDKLKNQRVSIFFTYKNSDSAEDNSFNHTSIRWATLVNYEISNETDVFHAYLKLDGFCNLTVDSNNSCEKKPPIKFFSSLACTESLDKNNWQGRVDSLISIFPKIIFFHIKGIYKADRAQILEYENKQKFCHYNLEHGGKYLLKISLGNPNNSHLKVRIYASKEITLNCINPLETSAQYDEFDIPISIKTLRVFKQASLLRFKLQGENGEFSEYATNIELNLKLSWKRLAIFGLFSTMAFWGFLLTKPMSSWPSVCLLVISTVAFFISSAALFYWFNKK